MNRTRLREQLIRHEGLRLKPYRCPAGRLTIGVGRNLDDKGLSAEERAVVGDVSQGITREHALLLLDNDITDVWRALTHKLAGVFTALDEARQHVMLDMAFNLGVDGLLRFKKMLAAVERRDFVVAAAEMRDSAWYRQVGGRGAALAKMMEGV